MASGGLTGWPGALLANPALWAVPLAVFTAVVVSLATPGRIPPGTARVLVRLHTPERVSLARAARAREQATVASAADRPTG